MNKIAIYCRTAQESPKDIQLQKKQVLGKIQTMGSILGEAPVIEFFEDDGYSGLNSDRPGYLALLQRIEQGTIDVVAMTDVTRIGRSSTLVYDFISLLKRKGIRLISLQRDYEPGKALTEERLRVTLQFH
jgi:DNA invertase Pin-like site-specific DNA recombinase